MFSRNKHSFTDTKEMLTWPVVVSFVSINECLFQLVVGPSFPSFE